MYDENAFVLRPTAEKDGKTRLVSAPNLLRWSTKELTAHLPVLVSSITAVLCCILSYPRQLLRRKPAEASPFSLLSPFDPGGLSGCHTFAPFPSLKALYWLISPLFINSLTYLWVLWETFPSEITDLQQGTSDGLTVAVHPSKGTLPADSCTVVSVTPGQLVKLTRGACCIIKRSREGLRVPIPGEICSEKKVRTRFFSSFVHVETCFRKLFLSNSQGGPTISLQRTSSKQEECW